MKIKKIFGLVSVCSLAVLMTACGKSSKNDGILDAEVLKVDSITKEEYEQRYKANKEVFKVFENQRFQSSMSNLEVGIIVTSDDDKYYVYNLNIENKKILEFNKDDINTIVTYSENSTDYIYVRYKQNDDNLYGYAAYLFDGRCIFNKEYLKNTISVKKVKEASIINDTFDDSRYYKLQLQYTVTEGEKSVTKFIYYFKVVNDTTDTYYTEEEFNNKYKENTDIRFPGSIFGLNGYELQSLGEKILIYKKNKLVNIITFANEDSIMSNGYFLYQVVREVGAKEDYDILKGDKYYKITTYRTNVLTSKTEEVKGFHYYISSNLDEIVSYDEDGKIKELKGALCRVYDFKEKKEIITRNRKLAVVKGNGEIEINKSLTQDDVDDVIFDGENYYSYSDESTVVNNKKGKVVGIYDGFYYDGVRV